MAKAFRIANPQHRADLYAQLAALDKAGFPYDQAIGMVDLPKISGLESVTAQIRARLARGANWVDTGRRYGLFSEFDAALLGAAFATGDLGAMYRRLADHYAAQSRRQRQIKARLVLPVAVLILATFIQPLPMMVTGQIGGGGYLRLTLLPLLKLAIGGYVLVSLPRWFREGALYPFKTAFDSVVLRLPVFGANQLRRNLRDLWSSLSLLLEAGVPMAEAFPKALNTIDNRVVRARFAQVPAALQRGSALADALRSLPLPGPPEALYFIATGEASGELPAMLRRYADREDEVIASFDEQLAEWLPRLVYTAIAIKMAAGILGSGAFMPQVPDSL